MTNSHFFPFNTDLCFLKNLGQNSQCTHHYIKGNISVFSRGFVCFCYFNPNFLHGDLHLYCAEYWGDSRMSALKKWGVKTQLLFFCPFWWLENQLCCHKSCIQTAVECLSSFESPLNQASMGCFYETMSN